MLRDKLLVPLLEIAQGTALNEYDLERMVGDEINRLSAGARIHDFIEVIAIKRVRDKVRQSASPCRSGGTRHRSEV